MKLKAQERYGLLSMIWPIIVELIITGVIANTTQAMINDFSPDAVAVIGSGSQIVIFILNIYCIISIGMTILLAPLAGAKHYEECTALINAALTVNLVLGAIVSLAGIQFIPAMLRFMNIPAKLHSMARQYLLVCIGFSFMQSMLITLNAVFRSLGEMKKVLYTMISVSLAAMAITKGISLFVPEKQQSMALYTFAGIAAQLLGIIMFMVMLYRHKRICYRYSFQGLYRTVRRMLPRILHYGIPAGCEGLVYLISQAVVVSFIGILGTQALLTKAIAGNVYYYMVVTTAATSAGASIITGHLIGEGRTERLGGICRKLILADILITAVISGFLLIIGPRFLGVYTGDTVIIAAAMKVIFFNMLLELIRCLTGNLVAMLKASGDVGFPFMAVILGSATNIAVSYYLGIVLEFGLAGIWAGYIADALFRGVVCWIRFGKNMRNHTYNIH